MCGVGCLSSILSTLQIFHKMFAVCYQYPFKNLCLSSKLKHISSSLKGRHNFQKRFKKKKIDNIDRAFDYFDQVYPSIYYYKWEDMKKALIEDPKYVAVINKFCDNEEVIKKIQELGAFDVGAFYTKRIREILPENKSSFQELQSIASKPQTDPTHPSLIQMNDEEKEALTNENESDIDQYPDIYKQRFIENSESQSDHEQGLCRVIKSSDTKIQTAALSHGHVPATKLKGLENWIEEVDVLKDTRHQSHPIRANRTTESEPIIWPENLKIYSFVQGEHLSNFPQPRPSPLMKLLPYFLLNGASILPVLALDLQQGDHVLDLCAGPGGKSLVMLQTLRPEVLFCNDKTPSRMNRVNQFFLQYIPLGLPSIWETITYSVGCGTEISHKDCFDKVLVDAPCLHDRHSLQESDNSIFKTSRIKERHTLPELQANLILAALMCTKPGGCVVYSTCTLSPLQNDGAVHLALTRVFRETQMECAVVDMTPTMKMLDFLYKFGHDLGLRYGHLVLPSITDNFGPMYISKIIREK